MADQQPYQHVPYSIEIEQALLGAALRDNPLINRAAAEISSADFYDPLHARLFDAIVYLSNAGSVTPLTLHATMKADPGVMEMGGQAYFDELFLAAPSIPNIRDYCNILKDLAMRRRMQTVATDLMNDSVLQPQEMTARAAADRATEALLEIGRAVSQPVLSAHDIAMESLREIEAMRLGKSVPIVKTGFTQVDEELGGLRGGDFIILPGKSGAGKSALAGTLSRLMASAMIPTIVFSLEMMRRQWVERMICDEDFDTAQKPMWYSRLRNGRLEDGEYERYVLAAQRLQGLPLEIRDEDDVTVQQISAISRAFKARNPDKTGVVIVDYLQIIQPLDPREQRERQVAATARGLKALAKRLNWPVIALCQMNENDAQRAKEEKRPQLNDLRESRVIGQEADIVLAPHRPAYFVENRKPECGPGEPEWLAWKGELATVAHRFDLLCLKNRHGRRVDFDLWCDMGASAIRNQEPSRIRWSDADVAATDLLTNVR